MIFFVSVLTLIYVINVALTFSWARAAEDASHRRKRLALAMLAAVFYAVFCYFLARIAASIVS